MTSRSELDVLRLGNRTGAPTGPRTHLDQSLTRWGRCGDLAVARTNTRRCFLKLHARVVWVDRAILCKGSTFGFHSAGKLHAGAVGHRRRAGRCAVQRLPGTEERSPAPWARPGRSSTEGPEPPRVLRPYGRSTLCTTVCSLSRLGKIFLES